MEKTAEKTSTWLALRNPVFQRLWLAMVISGSCIGAHNWVASQRAMPDWARGRMNETMVMVAQAATALGGVIWGLAAHHGGVVPTFLGAAVFALVLMIVVRIVPDNPSFFFWCRFPLV
jgi:predicted MFS family arabinose efflux permease